MSGVLKDGMDKKLQMKSLKWGTQRGAHDLCHEDVPLELFMQLWLSADPSWCPCGQWHALERWLTGHRAQGGDSEKPKLIGLWGNQVHNLDLKNIIIIGFVLISDSEIGASSFWGFWGTFYLVNPFMHPANINWAFTVCQWKRPQSKALRSLQTPITVAGRWMVTHWALWGFWKGSAPCWTHPCFELTVGKTFLHSYSVSYKAYFSHLNLFCSEFIFHLDAVLNQKASDNVVLERYTQIDNLTSEMCKYFKIKEEKAWISKGPFSLFIFRIKLLKILIPRNYLLLEILSSSPAPCVDSLRWLHLKRN